MRILLVEDEEKLARFVAKGLQAERLAVDVARSGEEGLEYVASFPYDMLVLDVSLPGVVSGTELLRRVRRTNAEVPVLMLTARGSIGDKVAHFEAGADDYLTKPFAFAELLIRIKALLRRGAVPRTNTIQVGDLEIDRLTHQVKRGGAPIRLTSKEYSLLEYFASNAGRILSRTMIIEHVWDQSFEGLTNIVDVYVRQLRSKIDEPFAASARLLHTIRNAGYCLSEKEEF